MRDSKYESQLIEQMHKQRLYLNKYEEGTESEIIAEGAKRVTYSPCFILKMVKTYFQC